MQNSGYKKGNFRQGIKVADEMGLSLQYSVNARRRFLVDELELLNLEIAFYDDYEGTPDNVYFSLRQYSFLAEKRSKVKQELGAIKNVTIHKPGITDDMIEQARNYPIGQLVEFTRGKAQAFCHEDKNPSAYHATRVNRINCPVCGKSFDPIGVLMERDGMSFKEAVTTLSRR